VISLNGWLLLIGGFLLFGLVIDLIVKKRKIEINPEEGAKNASESERVYVESTLHNIRQDHNNIGNY
jgi:hypothetical protein